jgi:hypothetical protein
MTVAMIDAMGLDGALGLLCRSPVELQELTRRSALRRAARQTDHENRIKDDSLIYVKAGNLPADVHTYSSSLPDHQELGSCAIGNRIARTSRRSRSPTSSGRMERIA